ncbi:MAG: sensor histidine kinase [Ruminococcaceae bacterium]|nr:sensor histidine kinase [Oscillospiraceae bacterium]
MNFFNLFSPKSRKYASRLLLYTAIFLYIFIFLTGILFYFFAVRTFDDINSESTALQSSYLEESITFELNNYQKTISMLLIDDAFARLINSISENPVKNSAYVQNYLNNLSTSYLTPITLDLYLSDHFPTVFYPSMHPIKDAENESWMQKIHSVNYNLIQWEYDSNGDLLCFCGLWDLRSTQINCYVKLTASANSLFTLADKYTDDPSITVLFYDQNNNLIYSSGHNTEKPIHSISQFLSGQTTLEKLNQKSNLNIITFDIEKVGFKVFFIQNKSTPENYMAFSKYLLIVLSAVIIASLTTLPLFTNMATRRLQKLNESVRAIDEEHLYYKNEINGDDEFAALSRSFEDMVTRISTLLEKTKQMENERFELEFKALQEQINPHFLYNSLSAINALATEIQADDISDSINALAGFYRLSLNDGRTTITVRDELAMLENYITICSIRYQNNLHFTLDVDENTLHCMMPKLILQPFIENSAFHGFYPEISEDPEVSLTIKRNDHDLIFTIADNGNGIPEEKLATITVSGFAISNIDRRLKLLYGDIYGIHIESQLGKGTVVTITIPAVEQEFDT